MHIYEGILAGTLHGKEVLAAGAAATIAGTAIGLYKLDYERIPRVAVLSSAFFAISLIQVPLGSGGAHLTLNALMGLVLGWAVFPAVLMGLLLQVLFFPALGVTSLGLNALVMALPGVVCHYLFRGAVRSDSEWFVFGSGFVAGATGIVLGALLAGAALFAAGDAYRVPAQIFMAGHLPVAGMEGLVTGSVVVLLRKVRPELLEAPLLLVAPQEY